jgi:hypothetical protein
MIETAQKHADAKPLIALVSSFGGKSYTFNVAYGVGKAAVDRRAERKSSTRLQCARNRFNASSSAALRELDERTRFVQNSAESTS